jgi:hypothetical protein
LKQINNFWNWFLDNQHTFKNLVNETAEKQLHTIYWIKQNLNYFSRELDFVIVFPKTPTDRFELIITSNGNLENFKHVIDLVDNAPLFKDWKFSC